MLTERSVRKRVSAIAAGLVIGLAAMTTPALADESPSPARSKTSFVIGNKQDVDSFNPYVGVVSTAFEMYQLMYDYLTVSSPKDFSPQAALAEKWETSADGLVWTFHLRKGVKWSDGQELTAKDVVYTFQRAKDDETANGQYGSYVTNLEKVEATDDYTVVMTTSQPSPIMLHLAVPIVPEHVWSEVDSKELGTFANTDHPVGSGPFRLEEVRKGEFYRFSANKQYWGGAPHIDELVLRIFAEDEAMAQALRNGEIDLMEEVAAPVFEKLVGAPGITTNDAKYYGFNELAYNLGAQTTDGKDIGDGHPALRDKQVRLAIDYALDRKTLVEKVLRNHGSAATGVIPPIYETYHWNPGTGGRSFDVAKANKILDDAGYAKGADGIRAKDGKALKFRLFGRESSEQSQKDAEYIRDWLKEIGIEVTVSIMSEDNLTTVIGQGQFDLFEWGWVVEPDPDFQLSVFTCDQRSTEAEGEVSGGWSDSFYCDADYDKIYAEQQTIIDQAKRAEVVRKAQQKLYEDVAYSMLFYYNQFEAYRSDRFTGFVPQPSDGGVLAFQYGTHSYRNIRPVEQKSTSDGSSKTLWIVGGAAAAVVVVGLVLALVLRSRRRQTADERE